jgi:hypothetical protein
MTRLDRHARQKENRWRMRVIRPEHTLALSILCTLAGAGIVLTHFSAKVEAPAWVVAVFVCGAAVFLVFREVQAQREEERRGP